MSSRYLNRQFGHSSRARAKDSSVPQIAPHGYRRTCAKLWRTAGGEAEQIQVMLGHQFVQTPKVES
jgi:integrase